MSKGGEGRGMHGRDGLQTFKLECSIVMQEQKCSPDVPGVARSATSKLVTE